MWTFHHVMKQNLDNLRKICISLPFSAGPSLTSLAIVSVCKSSGQPPTWFPRGGLAEWPHTPMSTLLWSPTQRYMYRVHTRLGNQTDQEGRLSVGPVHPFSYYSSRRKNTPTLRVITLREGRTLPLYESLLFEKRVPFFTSYCFSIALRGKSFPLYDALRVALQVRRQQDRSSTG